MTEGPVPGDETTKHKYVYDAFNRLVKITDSSDVSQVEYEYDGMNRRIRRTDTAADPDIDYDYYYNESWQLLEVRKDQDTDPLKQHVWHDYYIDALAVTWYDDDVDGADVEELYFTHDANFNVTTLLDDTGAVQERYEYETYGHPAVLDSDFSDDGDGVSDWEHEILFAGYQYDPDAALYHVRNRVYQPALGRWVQRDPVGYVDGGSLYEYVVSSPMSFTDVYGLAATDCRASCAAKYGGYLGYTTDPAFRECMAKCRGERPDGEPVWQGGDTAEGFRRYLVGICRRRTYSPDSDCTPERCRREARTLAILYGNAVRHIREHDIDWCKRMQDTIMRYWRKGGPYKCFTPERIDTESHAWVELQCVDGPRFKLDPWKWWRPAEWTTPDWEKIESSMDTGKDC